MLYSIKNSTRCGRIESRRGRGESEGAVQGMCLGCRAGLTKRVRETYVPFIILRM